MYLQIEKKSCSFTSQVQGYTHYYNNSSNTAKLIYLKLTFRPQSEAFIRRSWYSELNKNVDKCMATFKPVHCKELRK